MVRPARSRTDLLPGTLELLVLKTVSIESMHGYAIAQHIKRVSSDLLQVEEGSLYPALQRLLAKGLVTAEWGQSETNRRARFYKLTAAGRRQLGIDEAGLLERFDAIRRVLRAGN
jgi:transcriptional regulator